MAATAVISAGVGVYQAIQGKNAAEDAAEEARLARIEMDRHKAEFEKLDTSNPYLNMQNMYSNMENTMEDLTINQQGAEFEKQQAMQSQANIMGQMRGAAGSSGIAALAQSLANSGSLQAQSSSARIADQEAANQKAAASEASRIQDLQLGEDSRIQGLEREGDLLSRNMQSQKIQALMGLSAGDVSNAQAMQAAGQQQMMAGISSAASSLGTLGGIDYDIGGNKTTEATDTTTTPTGTSLPPTGTVGTGTYAQWQTSGDSNFMTFDEWKQQGN